jgi:hypothetical protein
MAAACGPALAADPLPLPISRDARLAVAAEQGVAGTTVLVGDGDAWLALTLLNGVPRLGPPREVAADPLPPDGLPHSFASAGGSMRRVWLAEPTERYAHGVLGDRLEAGALKVEMRDGRVLTHRLGPEAVFEDLAPRIVRIDGAEMILVVRSRADAGAAPVLYRVADAIVEHAAAPPIGTANRWLNPVGVADFDGDGRVEIAVVETPHVGGVLKLYGLDGAQLVERARWRGASNHDIGSTELRLHAIADFDGNGRADIAVRLQGGRSIAILGLAEGSIREIARVAHEVRISGPLLAADLDRDGRPELLYRLENGATMLWRP